MNATEQDSGPGAAEKISQLGQIDRDVAELLRSAGLAIKTLTCTEIEADGYHHGQSQTMEERQQDFATASSRYFSLLSSIDVRLRRHISALEDAEIIPSEAVAKDSQSSRDAPTVNMPMSNNLLARPVVSGRDAVTNGGMGNLDVGWLNSRNENVGRAMEANLWKEAHELLETTLEAKDRGDVTMSNDAAASSEKP
ncbi:MAG: hypothetical protein LQ349_001138 [Xanthoria aureola]|nr:MAG: hypothetical protein LQ349_001138 [Xanthoria aureola]